VIYQVQYGRYWNKHYERGNDGHICM
jgi:hypothetical protein